MTHSVKLYLLCSTCRRLLIHVACTISFPVRWAPQTSWVSANIVGPCGFWLQISDVNKLRCLEERNSERFLEDAGANPATPNPTGVTTASMTGSVPIFHSFGKQICQRRTIDSRIGNESDLFNGFWKRMSLKFNCNPHRCSRLKHRVDFTLPKTCSRQLREPIQWYAPSYWLNSSCEQVRSLLPRMCYSWHKFNAFALTKPACVNVKRVPPVIKR